RRPGRGDRVLPATRGSRRADGMTCRLSAVVVAFAGDNVVARCLSSVERALDEIDDASEAIVVLNRPMHELRQALDRGWTVLQPERNLGFAGGIVAGLAHARGEWL